MLNMNTKRSISINELQYVQRKSEGQQIPNVKRIMMKQRSYEDYTGAKLTERDGRRIKSATRKQDCDAPDKISEEAVGHSTDVTSSTREFHRTGHRRSITHGMGRLQSISDDGEDPKTFRKSKIDEQSTAKSQSPTRRRSEGSRRRQSVFEILDETAALRRGSLPSWVLKEDVESFLEKIQVPERRISLEQPYQGTRRPNSGTLRRWRQRTHTSGDKHMKLSPFRRFRLVARLAALCAWACGNSYQKLEKMKRDTLPISHYMEEYFETSTSWAFDPSYYKVQKQHQGQSLELKRIFSKDPATRTQKEIDIAGESFRWNPAFVAHPKAIQDLVCRNAWCETYGPHRTILRQGDRQFAMYFIVEGILVESIEDSKEGNICKNLYRGQAFGREVRECRRMRRSASVISKTNITVMAIQCKDFEDIFMADGLKNAFGADYNNFLGNVAFLKGWPVEKLSEYPSSCMFQYFNVGRTIVQDSNDSDWIYIVKSGSISVMKKLRHVTPRKSVAWERENLIAKRGPNVNVPFRERRRRQKILPPIKLPDVPRPEFSSQFELQMKMEETIPGAYKENDRLGILDYDHIINDYKGRVRLTKLHESPTREMKVSHRKESMRGDELEEQDTDTEEREDEKQAEEAGQPSRFPDIHRTTRGVFMSASKSQKRKRRMTQSDDKENDEGQHNKMADSETEDFDGEIDERSLAQLPPHMTSSRRGSEVGSVSRDAGFGCSSTSRPVFILVQVLEKGQYFGVGDVVFRESQPSLSVVSNGAECLLISKSFFRQHSSESIINSLRKTEVPYPSEAELQEKLQVNTDWLSYRKGAYHTLVDPIVDRRSRRRQYTHAYSGQYNFRSGPT